MESFYSAQIDIVKQKNDESLKNYILTLNTNEKKLYVNLRKQVINKRKKDILHGSNTNHTYNTNPNINENYQHMLYLIDKEIIINEKYYTEKHIIEHHEKHGLLVGRRNNVYFEYVRSEMFNIISKQISETVKDMGPEVYFLVLHCMYMDKTTIKQCSLVSKRFLNELKSFTLKITYNGKIPCYNKCGNKMYMDADAVYYYSCVKRHDYENNIMHGLPTCPSCLNNYVRLKPDDTISEFLAWNECSKCKVLFIDGMFKGEVLKCKNCRGNPKYNNTRVTIKEDNFIW